MGIENNVPQIQSITFHEGAVEIVYSEARDIETLGETGILRTRAVVCPFRHVEQELNELVDDARELLDKILVAERNPPSSYGR
jgi:hypothetical protein